MSVLDTLILTSCIGMSGTAKEACNNALIAGSKQSGIEYNIDHLERKTTRNIEKDARNYLGDYSVNLIAGTAIATKTLLDKTATVRLPTLGLCHSIVARVSQNQSLLSFEWKY